MAYWEDMGIKVEEVRGHYAKTLYERAGALPSALLIVGVVPGGLTLLALSSTADNTTAMCSAIFEIVVGAFIGYFVGDILRARLRLEALHRGPKE